MTDDIIDRLSYYVANEMRMPAGLIVTVIEEIEQMHQSLLQMKALLSEERFKVSALQSMITAYEEREARRG